MSSLLSGDDFLTLSVPSFSGFEEHHNDEEEALRWDAIERLPTYDRLKKGMLSQVIDNGTTVSNELDLSKLGIKEKKKLMSNILNDVEKDNQHFLRKLLRDRIDR